MSSIKLDNDKIIFNTAEYDAPTTQTTSFPSIGTMLLWAGSDISKLPTNFLPCDGRSLSTITYSLLFGIISYTYSETSSGSSFKIPNMQSKFAIGSNDTNAKVLQTSTLINLVSGGIKQITNAHFPHSHAGKISFTDIYHSTTFNIETQQATNTRSSGFSNTDTTSFTSSNPVGTSNQTSNEYYPPYCIFMYIIRVS